jgi:hypothetical protein
MKLKAYFVFFIIFFSGCIDKEKIDINKLTKNYFLGHYKSNDLSGIKIDVLIKDSIYYCDYIKDDISITDSSSWYLISYGNYKELVMENFPIEFIQDKPEIKFRKNKISFEIDCDNDLGDLIYNYNSGEREMKLIKVDKSKNKDYLRKS